MMADEMIYKRDLPLYIDVTCYSCKRLCALSNTVEIDGRHMCGRCAGLYQAGDAVKKLLADVSDITMIRID